jgi:hypothetical protein
MGLLLAAVLLAADPTLEPGAVMRSDGAAFFRNTIPQVAKLGNDQLLTVWAAFAKSGGPGRVYAAFSADHGRTWGAPKLLLADPAKTMTDPNILIDGARVFVFAKSHRQELDHRYPQ